MQLLYFHDKALGSNHPIFSRINAETKAVFIWDDAYFKQRGYSLKRLVFIYETLCSMPVDIIYGTTSDVIKTIAPTKIITSFTADLPIQNIFKDISKQFELEFVYQPSFSQIDDSFEFKRFFKYWNKAKKTALKRDGI